MCDNGTIYVREKGNLRRVSDIVLAQPKPVSSCRRTNPFVLRKEHFIFTYNAEGSLRYTTKSLFDITLLFVVDNIHHVDSLVGFPEQIGDRLFAAAEETRVFSNTDISPKALQLFNDAYGQMVLGSLCLRNRFPLFHERMSEIKTFHSLKSLDLFGCRLGDDHEIFQHLTSNLLANSLIQLFIGGNGLSDVGLQRLTAPIRMMKRGLDCLQILDISYNPISERALRYLTCLPKLEKLDVSGTTVKPGEGLKKTVWDLLGLICSDKALDTFDHSNCKTEGWAEQVVNQWEINTSQMPKHKKIEASRASALQFFGRQKFVREVLNAAPLVFNSEEEAKNIRLHFYRPAGRNHLPEKWVPQKLNHQAKTSWHNVKKRQRRPESCYMRCKLACTNQDGLLKHYRLRHGRGANWPCIYSDCVCTFRTHGALKIHLTRSHCKTRRREVKCTFFTSDITMHRSRACLEGLPLFLRDTSELFLKCLDTDPEDRQTKGVQMGVLTVFVGDGAPASLQTVNCIAVVLEETIVLKDIPDLPTAFAYLFGLLYALNIEFPRHLRYTFETVQHIFMELKSFCSQRVRSLKTKLLL